MVKISTSDLKLNLQNRNLVSSMSTIVKIPQQNNKYEI